MDSKNCTRCNIEKVLKIFSTNIQNVKFVIVTEI